MLKVLFLESQMIWTYGLPDGFKDAGHDVKVSYIHSKEQFQELVSHYNPDLILTLGQTQKHSLEQRELLREYTVKSKVPYVYWDTEGITHSEKFILPFIRSTAPDFVFTVCPEASEAYKGMGIQTALLEYAYHPKVHFKADLDEQYSNSIAVVGDGYPYVLKNHPQHCRSKSIQALVKPLVENRIKIDFWGRQWDKISQFIGSDIPSDWIRGYCHYLNTNKIYSNASINLGLQNHNNYLSRRTYEIIASEGFLISFDTPEIRRLFKPGQDIIVSSSPRETIELVNHYHKNPDERDNIKTLGKKVIENHTYMHRAEYIISTLKKFKIL